MNKKTLYIVITIVIVVIIAIVIGYFLLKGGGGKSSDSQQHSCSGYKCNNGGSCRLVKGNAECDCVAGYSGDHCDTYVCDSFECQNNGTCNVTSSGDAKCDCVAGYSGDHCDTSVCDSFECQNKGTCNVTSSGDAECDCAAGYKGDHCETATIPQDVLNFFAKYCPKYKDKPVQLAAIIEAQASKLGIKIPTSAAEAAADAVKLVPLIRYLKQQCKVDEA